jgi:hypothetical protein
MARIGQLENQRRVIMIGGLGSQELWIILPFALLAGWFVFYRRKKYSAILVFSILLVVFDLPHLSALNAVFSGRSINDTMLFVAFLGVGCLALGIYGIIYSARAMSRKSAN